MVHRRRTFHSKVFKLQAISDEDEGTPLQTWGQGVAVGPNPCVGLRGISTFQAIAPT